MTGSFSPEDGMARSMSFPLSCCALSSCGDIASAPATAAIPRNVRRSIMRVSSWGSEPHNRQLVVVWLRHIRALLPHQLEGLQPLLHEGTGHLPLAIDMELDDTRLGSTEADLGARRERDFWIGARRLHEQCRPVAAEGEDGTGWSRVFTDVAVKD